jgi:hypothetical protein
LSHQSVTSLFFAFVLALGLVLKIEVPVSEKYRAGLNAGAFHRVFSLGSICVSKNTFCLLFAAVIICWVVVFIASNSHFAVFCIKNKRQIYQ